MPLPVCIPHARPRAHAHLCAGLFRRGFRVGRGSGGSTGREFFLQEGLDALLKWSMGSVALLKAEHGLSGAPPAFSVAAPSRRPLMDPPKPASHLQAKVEGAH